MKWCLILSLFFSAIAYSFEIKVECQYKNECSRFEDEVYAALRDAKLENRDLKRRLKFLLFDKTVSRFLFDYDKKKKVLKVEIGQKKRISSLQLNINEDLDLGLLQKMTPFKEGQIFRERDQKSTRTIIKNYLSERGYNDVAVNYNLSSNDNLLDLQVNIRVGDAVIIRRINIKSNQTPPAMLKYLTDIFNRFVGKAWDKVRFGEKVEDVRRELLVQGYVASSIVVETKENKEKNEVIIDLKINLGEKKHFYFVGNSLFSRQELIENIQTAVKNLLGKFSESEVKNTINKKYEAIGIYGTKIDIRKVKGKSRTGSPFSNYYCDIHEGRKSRVGKIIFRGNLQIQDEEIEDWYEEDASVLASRGFFDRGYAEQFAQILKNKYLRRGFVFADIESPLVLVDGDEVTIQYEIREGQQCLVRDILLKNVSEELAEKMKRAMDNRKSKPFDSISLGQDFKNIIFVAKNEGYYFAEIKNLEKKSIVKFTSDYSEVTVNVDFALDKRTILDEVIISGNVETKDIVVEREVDIDRGEIITFQSLNEIQSRIASLGLFSSVEITPYVTNRESEDEVYLANLLIRVQEIKFGAVEVAPGFRSDIGWKVSAGVSYNNIGGMNRLAALRVQTNWRTNLNELDERRREENKRLLEGGGTLKISEPSLFGTGLGSSLSISASRKRFYGYDADIARLSSTLSKEFFSDRLSLSLTYKLETIDQFDASESKDEGSFRIGGLTPSISLNFLNDAANPSKGVSMSFSSEFANPDLGSQKSDKLEVNFMRLVSRNRLYFPMGKWVGAISLSFGYEKNQAIGGYIPGIKVFRLTGIDTVRGFEDEEINRLASGQDISEVTVDDSAYFLTLKIEPRYKLSDSTVVGFFWDLGRVYVNKFEPTDLRSSFGTSFKFLTPVGSLNFDYGIKFERKSLSDGSKEGFGRFHLLIGYF